MLNSLAQFARKLEKYTGEKVEVKDEEEIELENSEAEDATDTDSKEELENSEAEDAADTDSKEELETSDPKSSIPDENEHQNNDTEQKQICKLNKKIEALEDGLKAIKTLLQIESAKDKDDDENELKSTPEDSKSEEGNNDEDFFENKELKTHKSKSKNKTHAVKEDDDEDFFENKELKTHKSKSKNKTHAVKCESKKVKKCGTLSYAKGYAYGKGFELLGNLKRGFTVNEPAKVKGKTIDLDVDIKGLPLGEWTIVKSKEGTYGIIKSKDIA
jgi:hypothetical protein